MQRLFLSSNIETQRTRVGAVHPGIDVPHAPCAAVSARICLSACPPPRPVCLSARWSQHSCGLAVLSRVAAVGWTCAAAPRGGRSWCSAWWQVRQGCQPLAALLRVRVEIMGSIIIRTD
jgi:hypothetical protein